MRKKIVAIITQPLDKNYGCLLQNWALQQVIKKMGYEVLTFDQHIDYIPPRIRIKAFLKGLIIREKKNVFECFINHNLRKTRKAYDFNDFKKFDRKITPYAYIVGSDQVWRPHYNRLLDASFLMFCQNRKKIAYAASFGSDEWEFDCLQRKKYTVALKQFFKVGVRERSAVDLCRNNFGVNAMLVLDPTLLLAAHEYEPITEKIYKRNYIFSYILDSNKWKSDIVKFICSNQQCDELAGMYDIDGTINERLSVGQWIAYLKEATFVVCDSFHAIAFSILMHRPFLVLGNSRRGNTRFISILNMFGLEDRLLMENENLNLEKYTEINWNDVDKRISQLRKESLDFLFKALTDN